MTWDHQPLAVEHVLNNPATLIDARPGAGKSKIVVGAIRAADLPRVLILCPAAVVDVWRRELAKWGTDHMIACLDGNTARRKIEQLSQIGGDCVVVVSYDSSRSKSLLPALAHIAWDFVVADESHRLKNGDSKTTISACKLSEQSVKRVAMTGTVCPHSPLDIFGQFKFLDPSVLGTNYAVFCQRFASPTKGCGGRITYNRLLRDRVPELRELYLSLAHVVDPRVLDDLPSIRHQRIYCDLNEVARSAYDDMEKSQVVVRGAKQWTAKTKEVALLRLQQITSGFLRGGDKASRIDHSKQAALSHLFDTIPRSDPIVVFARFRSDLETIQETAAKCGREYREVSGNRNDLTEHATMPDIPGVVMGVQIASGGTGVDLTAARYAIYYSIDFSLGLFDQSVARLHRPGQNHSVMVYHLVARDTIDQAIYNAVRNKRSAISEFLNATGAA